MQGFRFNTPPGWPTPPEGWVPPDGWLPDPSWPPAPVNWAFWIPDDGGQTGSPRPKHRATEPAVEAAEVALPDAGSAPKQDIGSEPTLPLSDDEAPAGERQRLAALRDEIAAETKKLADLRASVESLRRQGSSDGGDDLEQSAADLRAQLVELNDALLLQQVGIYEYHHPLENADAYRERLADLRERTKTRVRSKEAVLASDMFSYNNSLAKGRKMTSDFAKLMLRAYNAEADNCVRSLRVGAVATAKKRLEASVETIARLGSMMEMRISPDYHALRLEEIELTADYLMKVQEEREQAREERERLREERKAEQELAAERERLDKERTHYLNALQALKDQGKLEEAAELEAHLGEIDKAIELNDFRAANIRAGYVYVISNIGAFGKDVVKIGLTRRLEPLDRIRELGDASVPFPFDVHALYFSDDAVTLENELHAAFADRRLNQVNLRREFFFATPTEVRGILAAKVGSLLEFSEAPEATQYFQSHAGWPARA
ncbi:T5orf172 domain-containing protein [Kribbella sp. VKM Ac-2527]|uniref:T5orf172 domain-containing protein n=1 Tax=Kribbella caucasensis TaxID=2512215 RepID=A0A4R6K7L4_9ACTN|nr:DUF4041 domain-containing protein [Kribbella sp. VKM Ac-2527]TDO45471.1 T5orf172 domain-containing protein [Kribbella sp. VKM Ac-2527]